jgi:hypothetical protein
MPLNEELEKGLLGYFKTAYDTAGRTEPIRYPGAPWQQPSTGPFAAIFVLPGAAQIAALGGLDVTFQSGIVAIQAFDGPEEGRAAVLDLLDFCDDTFRNKATTLSAGHFVQFWAPEVSAPNLGEDGWMQTNLSVPYVRDVHL